MELKQLVEQLLQTIKYEGINSIVNTPHLLRKFQYLLIDLAEHPDINLGKEWLNLHVNTCYPEWE